ncbi:MAG: protein kinase [Kofleriaceae bacterium]
MYSESPRTLGKYRLIAEIARGGMGIVYLALLQGPSGFSKLLVVKELKPELVEEPAFLQMFLEEARLAARLNHSNIVQTNEVGNDAQHYFMAMDYLDGRGLERIRRRARHIAKPMSLPLQLRVLCDVLAGLEYAHTFTDFDGTPLGIVHRDVSPQNVFLTFEGQVKLLDFGIAKTIESVNETRAGVLKGKLMYMAPEQARGERVDARADVFAVGVMLWETLTGKNLRASQSEHQILSDLVAKITPPRASTVDPDVAPELDEICARALAPDRADRYHSAATLQSDLEAYLISLGRPVNSRELGAYLREIFHEDRIKTSSMIEQTVARVRTGAETDDDLPIIDVSYTSGDLRTPVSGERSELSAPSGSANRPVGTLDRALEAPPPVTTAPSQVFPAAPAPAKSRMLWIVLPVVMGGGVLLGGLLYTKAQVPTAPTAPLTTNLPAARPPSPPIVTPTPSSNLIDVEISAVPPLARIEIDGAEVSGNPFKGRYIGDGAMHQVKVSAPGHIAKTTAVSFDGAVALNVQLERVAVARPQPTHVRVTHVPVAPSPPVTAPPPPPPSEPRPELKPPPGPTEVNPNGGAKPHRTIDPNNPYAK